MNQRRESATVASSLRVANGLTTDERDRVVSSWGRLDSRLRSFADGKVDLLLTVKERGAPSQRATLEARIDGRPRLVAISTHADFDEAMTELREDLIRQISDLKNRSEPRNNRSRRGTIRTAEPAEGDADEV